jgi:hypothetical protein
MGVFMVFCWVGVFNSKTFNEKNISCQSLFGNIFKKSSKQQNQWISQFSL